jgi:hypothetical protein
MDNYSISKILETLTWMSFFAAIILSYYFYLRFRNKERMALIEKGIDVSEIFKNREFTFKFPWLRLGILVLGIGIGILFAYLLIDLIPMPDRNPNYYYSRGIIITFSLLISGGLGIILGNVFERPGKKKNG